MAPLLSCKPAGADPVVVVERGLWLGGGGLVHKLQVHHRLRAPVLTLRQVLAQLPSAHGNRPSGKKKKQCCESLSIPFGSGSVTPNYPEGRLLTDPDIFEAIEKNMLSKTNILPILNIFSK
jgi:hypothetical protein